MSDFHHHRARYKKKTMNRIKRIFLALAAFMAIDSHALIPRPQKIVRRGGELTVPANTVEEAAKSATFERDVTIQSEGYAISVVRQGITVRSSDERGAACGYSSAQNFATQFRLATGRPHREWRSGR